jgi:hypothetical protein
VKRALTEAAIYEIMAEALLSGRLGPGAKLGEAQAARAMTHLPLVETRLHARRKQIAATDVERALRASLRRIDGRGASAPRVARRARGGASARNSRHGATSARRSTR